MEVILLENYPSLGYVGERVKVKRGYARNYLIRQGIAVEASSGSAKQVRHRQEMVDRKKKRLLTEAQKVADGIKGLTLEFTLSSSQGGKSFGSITVRDIESGLIKRGVTIDRKQIKLQEPIKVAGEYSVDLQLHSDLSVPIDLKVVQERIVKSSPASENVDSGRSRRRKAKSYDDTFEQDIDADFE
jgi:large subunit ribosomal protein L9